MSNPLWLETDGAFETCRVKTGRVVRLDDHLERLRASLKTLGIGDWNEQAVRSELAKAARGIRAGYVRAAVRRGAWCGFLLPQPVRREGAPRLLIHRHAGVPYPAGQIRRGVSIRTVASRWPASETGWAQVKSSDRLGSVLARAEAGECAEALRIGRHGFLTEGTVSNLFLVRSGTLVTPPGWLGVLEGVTRHRVLEAARRLRLSAQIEPVTRHDLFNAEEAFLTNVLMEILPIREVDGRRIGTRVPGSVTRRLMRAVMGER